MVWTALEVALACSWSVLGVLLNAEVVLQLNIGAFRARMQPGMACVSQHLLGLA